MDKLEDVVLLHDGDIFAYRAASATDGRQYEVSWTTESGPIVQEYYKYKKDADLKAAETNGSVRLFYDPEPKAHALSIVKQLMATVLTDTQRFIVGTPAAESFLTSGGSFREIMCPSYKSNRKDIRRPEHLQTCKDYLTGKHDAVTRAGEYEADDLLTMRATELQALGKTPIIVSVDKDLKQMSGWHWDFVKKELIEISDVSGDRNLYRQLLTGDTTDGIIGIKGMGPKTAAKIIDHLYEPFDMYCACLKEWFKYLKPEIGEIPRDYQYRVVSHVKMNMRLLYLLRKEGEHWEEPDEH